MGTDSKSNANGKTGASKKQPFLISSEPQFGADTTEETENVTVANALSEIEASPTPTSIYDNLGELPAFYQTGKIYLAARDPHWLFCYWDIDLESVGKAGLGDAAFHLKVYQADGKLIDQIRVNTQAKNWYFPIKDAGVSYYVELGFTDPKEKWSSLATSNEAFAPTDSFVDGPAEFASVPFHLSFDRMLEIVRSELAAGQSLVGALSRLQQSSDPTLQKMAALWTEEQKLLLESLVGAELMAQVSLGSHSSSDINQLFRQRLGEALSENLSSAASSELSFLRNLTVAPWNESSLFSGAGASWSFAAGGDTSWTSGSGFTAESSWLSALGGESSWSGGLGSSWSAQPFGNVERDFFMHVNAEVIFYGGTHPDATVWIDGKEVALSADGSFRYHFRLPDGEFEIPIVAESPDGVEIRSAKLVFKRGTTRHGEVGSTSQPDYLNNPWGQK